MYIHIHIYVYIYICMCTIPLNACAHQMMQPSPNTNAHSTAGLCRKAPQPASDGRNRGYGQRLDFQYGVYAGTQCFSDGLGRRA